MIIARGERLVCREVTRERSDKPVFQLEAK